MPSQIAQVVPPESQTYHWGSSASMSKDKWMGVSLPIQPSAISMTLPMPWLGRKGQSKDIQQAALQIGKGGDIPIDIMHAKRLDPIVPQDLPLSTVNVPKSNVD